MGGSQRGWCLPQTLTSPCLGRRAGGWGSGVWGEGPGEGMLQVGWSPGSVLCTPAQGLPGPSGEKGETGDVGPMVSVAPLTGWAPPDPSLTC